MNDKLEYSRAGCEKIDNTIQRKQPSVNYEKSKFLIMGNPKYRKDTLKAIKERPMNMGGVVIEHSEKEKYLGDMIHEKRMQREHHSDHKSQNKWTNGGTL